MCWQMQTVLIRFGNMIIKTEVLFARGKKIYAFLGFKKMKQGTAVNNDHK